MPELPEVETVCRGLERACKGRTFARVELKRKDLRFPFPKGFAKYIAGSSLLRVERRAKYLLLHLSNGRTLIAHLGMSGSFHTNPTDCSPHDHVMFHFTDGGTLIYRDPRRFGLMDIIATPELHTHPLLENNGPEPFSSQWNTAYLKRELSKRSQAIKVALLDQALVAGVGNIYASEVCFACKLHPATPAKLAVHKAALLVKHTRAVLKKAIDSGGSSLRDFIHVDGNTGYFQHAFDVYDRAGEACHTCGSKIIELRQAGRASFYCPRCQT